MILLDSDVMIDLLRGYPPARQWFDSFPDEKFLVLIRQELFDYTEWQKMLWHGQTVTGGLEALAGVTEHN